MSQWNPRASRRRWPIAIAVFAALCAIGLGCGVAALPNTLASANSVPFLSTPSGFHVTYVSKRAPGARFIAFAPNGDLVIAETAPGDLVVVAPGSPPDAPPATFASGLPLPHGVAFLEGKLYVATWSGVVRYNYPSNTPTTLFSNMPEGPDHHNRALAVAGDGTIFVSSGSTCNVCDESDPRYATVLRYGAGDAVGTIHADGLRNASGLAFDARGRLWAVVNQRDNIGPTQAVTDNLPPDELDLISAGENFGWPRCYPNPSAPNRLPNPEYSSAKCSGQTPAKLNFQAHSSPLGIAFYYATLFPPEYRGNAFVAFHGSWNRSVPTGDKVVRVTFAAGKPTGYADFVTGWLRNGSYRGRPVGLAVGPDGALYISDDKLGYIYRVSYGP